MQRMNGSECQTKNNEMRPLTFLLLIVAGLAFSQCDKSEIGTNESVLYGTWVKGNQTGDTLTFVKKNGKNVILYNMTHNPGFAAPMELEYAYRNGQLSIKGYPAGGADFKTIDSFNWKQVGEEFNIEGTILFPFLALFTVTYTYQKI